MNSAIKQSGLGLFTLILLNVSALAFTAEQKCEGGKKLAAGKYAACRLKAEGSYAKTGDAAKRSEALAKCQTKLLDSFTKLEGAAVAAGTTCPTTMDGAAMQGYLAACSDQVTSATIMGGGVPSCGDDDVNAAGEQCDGTDLDATTCTSLGFNGGMLGCDGTCNFDTSACTVPSDDCGNGVIDAGEDCDQSNLDGGTCVTEGLAGGALKCTTGCAYDSSDCYTTRFIDNADGSITDNQTGLIWEKKIKRNGTADLANRQDADNHYLWAGTCSVGGAYCQPDAVSAAACLAGFANNSHGCSQCVSGTCNAFSVGTVWQWLVALNASNFAGSNQWRIPTITELATLAVYDDVTPPAIDAAFHNVATCGAACSDVTSAACACTESDSTWSAGTYVPIQNWAWFVSFLDGYTAPDYKNADYVVRAVRGGS